MNLRVEYMSQLRTCTGCQEEDCTLPDGATAERLLHQVAERYGDAVRGVLFDDAGNLDVTVLCFVANEQVERDHPLAEGDVVTLITPISGG